MRLRPEEVREIIDNQYPTIKPLRERANHIADVLQNLNFGYYKNADGEETNGSNWRLIDSRYEDMPNEMNLDYRRFDVFVMIGLRDKLKVNAITARNNNSAHIVTQYDYLAPSYEYGTKQDNFTAKKELYVSESYDEKGRLVRVFATINENELVDKGENHYNVGDKRIISLEKEIVYTEEGEDAIVSYEIYHQNANMHLTGIYQTNSLGREKLVFSRKTDFDNDPIRTTLNTNIEDFIWKKINEKLSENNDQPGEN